MRKAVKLILKLFVLPLIAVVILIVWILIFCNSIYGVITGILSGLFCLTGIASYLFGLASGQECLKMLVAAFVLFIVPYAGSWLIGKIAMLRYGLGDFLRS